MRVAAFAFALGWLLAAPPAGAELPLGPAEYVGSFRWQIDAPGFGGFSGLDSDGETFVAVSDRGRIVEGRFLREAEGRITGIHAGDLLQLRDPAGAPLRGSMADAEGVALGPDGRVYVAFEGRHRVWAYDTPGGPATELPRHRDFTRFPPNEGLEALAIDASGTLFTLPERLDPQGYPFPVYRFRDGRWDRPFSIPQDGGFMPVGADFGPEGLFYLLEREFLLLEGFRSRVRRFEIAGDIIGPGELVLQTRDARHGNLEGLAVWEDGEGSIRLTMIADDNFIFLLQTEFVEYRLRE